MANKAGLVYEINLAKDMIFFQKALIRYCFLAVHIHKVLRKDFTVE